MGDGAGGEAPLILSAFSRERGGICPARSVLRRTASSSRKETCQNGGAPVRACLASLERSERECELAGEANADDPQPRSGGWGVEGVASEVCRHTKGEALLRGSGNAGRWGYYSGVSTTPYGVPFSGVRYLYRRGAGQVGTIGILIFRLILPAG